MKNIEKVYSIRFNNEEQREKAKIWSVLVRYFFQKYVSNRDTVLDLAAGYCEFINNIQCKEKIAVDMSNDTKNYANKNVKVIKAYSTDIKKIRDSSVDVVFVSNFFEHLTVPEIEQTLEEIRRILKKGGRFLLLQPNYKYSYKVYWDFIDHVTALTEVSIREVLEKHGFEII